MAALFTRRHDRWFRRALALALIPVLLVLSLAVGIIDPAWFRVAEAAPPQTVPFSHALHVGEVGVDCRYCHDSVERAPSAGFPQMWTCASCHLALDPKPELATLLIWNRVQELPDHSYFHHGAHISAGVGCSTCHGNVAEMTETKASQPFTMEWCLSCHRDPAPHLRPPDKVTALTWTPPDPAGHDELLAARGIDPVRLDHCYVCHR